MSDDPSTALAEAVAAKVDALTKELREAKNKNGRHDVVVPRWLAGVAATVFAAAIIGLFTFVITNSERLAVIESRDPVPRPEVIQRLLEHERRLGRLEGLHDGGRQP